MRVMIVAEPSELRLDKLQGAGSLGKSARTFNQRSFCD